MPEILISDLAGRSGVPASTLRYYEQQGLLPARRTAAGYRIYDQASVERLRFISAAKYLHLSLDSIRDLLRVWEAEPCRTVKAQLQPMIVSRLAQVDDGIAELRELESSLRVALCRLDELPDRGEHCDSDCALLAERPTVDLTAVPVACSLDGAAHEERLAQWHELLADAPIDQIAQGVRVTLPAATATVLAGLIMAEQQCCPFLHFRLDFHGPELHLMITADEAGLTFIDDLLHVDRMRQA